MQACLNFISLYFTQLHAVYWITCHHKDWCLIDDIQSVRETVQEVEEQAVGLRKDYIEDKELPQTFLYHTLPGERLKIRWQANNAFDLGQPSELESFSTGSMDISSHFLPSARFGGQLKPLMDHIDKLTSQGEALTIVSRQSSRLQELWKEHALLSFRICPLPFMMPV